MICAHVPLCAIRVHTYRYLRMRTAITAICAYVPLCYVCAHVPLFVYRYLCIAICM